MLSRKRTAPMWLVLVALVAMPLLAGCASEGMKGTPFYEGVTYHPPDAMERRVNLWPVAYYYDPFLSVLWPIFEKSDTQVAVRPLFGVAKLDREKHQYNVLWPIGEFDFETDEHRFFPFFWEGSSGGQYGPYFTIFPVVWYGRNDYFILFPLVWQKPDEFCVFPIFWYEKEDHFAVFPLYMNFVDEKSTHVLWPLFHVRRDEEPSWHFGPLAGDWKGADSRYSYLLFPLGHRYRKEDYGLDMFLPLYAKESGTQRDTLVTPLYISNDDHETGEKFRFIAPTWFDYQKPDGGMRALFPLYFGRREGEEKLWLTPLVGHRQRPGAETWIITPLLSAHTRADTYDETWALAPLTRFRWGDGPNVSHVLPFYYYDGEREAFFSPLYARMKNEDNSVTRVIPPLLSSRTKGKDFTRTWSPWPLVMNESDAKGRKSFAIPFYGYDGSKNRFLSLPYSQWGTADDRVHAFLGPLFVHEKQPDESRGFFLWPFTSLGKTKYGWDGWFTLFIHDRDSTGRVTWAPWPFVHFYDKAYDRGSWFFPLWSRNTSRYVPPRPEGPAPGQGLKATPRRTADDPDWAPKDSNFRLLLWLYTCEREYRLDKTHARVLWHVVDYKREGATKSLDVFPAISYDRDAETGFRKFSFLWRFLRYQRDADGGKKMDILFVPVMRKAATTATAGTADERR
jgi:hypothetical protein